MYKPAAVIETLEAQRFVLKNARGEIRAMLTVNLDGQADHGKESRTETEAQGKATKQQLKEDLSQATFPVMQEVIRRSEG